MSWQEQGLPKRIVPEIESMLLEVGPKLSKEKESKDRRDSQ
jgi:hypothetical protein